jgi:hypothetical protein
LHYRHRRGGRRLEAKNAGAAIRQVGAQVEMVEAREPRPLTGDEVLLEREKT